MSPPSRRYLLLALLAAWTFFTWPNWEEQWSTTRQTWAVLGPMTWDERTAIEWPSGFRAAREIASRVPAQACVLVLARTSPEKLEYYKARFPYYLYPRQLRFAGRTDAPAEGCDHLVVFRDDRADPHWDEGKLQERTAGMTRVFADERLEIYR